MAYNETLANRVRALLMDVEQLEERILFQGLSFMVNEKLCICIRGDELMCRIDPLLIDDEIQKPGIRQMMHNGRKMTGYIYVNGEILNEQLLKYYVRLCLDYNKQAKKSK